MERPQLEVERIENPSGVVRVEPLRRVATKGQPHYLFHRPPLLLNQDEVEPPSVWGLVESRKDNILLADLAVVAANPVLHFHPRACQVSSCCERRFPR